MSITGSLFIFVAASAALILCEAVNFGIQKDKSIIGGDYYSILAGQAQCLTVCKMDTRCRSYVWSHLFRGICWLKSVSGPVVDNDKGTVVQIVRSDPQPPNPREWIPAFKFDKAHQCYPDYAMNKMNGRCKKKLDKNVPVYYYGKKCGSFGYRLQYWLFFGHQKGCFIGFGGKHDNDWEMVQINLRQCGDKYCLDSVMYSQHNGWYTRRQTRGPPSIYVGKIAHGMFYNSCCGKRFTWWGVKNKCQAFCTSITQCFYYGDYRNPGQHWRPHNLKPVETVEKGGAVARVITNHKKTEICEKESCKGNSKFRIKDAGCKDNNWTHEIY